MDFKTVSGLLIPEGEVTQIADASGAVLWKKQSGGEYTFKDELMFSYSTLDTGIMVRTDDYFYAKFTPLSTDNGFVFSAGEYPKMARLSVSNDISVTLASSTFLLEDHSFQKTTVEIDNWKITRDGTLYYNYTGVPGEAVGTSLKLSGGTLLFIHEFKHGKTKDSLDIDYVPAIRNSDNAIGLYNKVTGTFVQCGDQIS